MFSLRSPNFEPGGIIPLRNTCDGLGLSPALSWSQVPHGTKSLALLMEDLDSLNGTWSHWLLYQIPPDVNALPEGYKPTNQDPIIQEGLNDWHELGYRGPCPPFGEHRYILRLYALNLDDLGLRQPTRQQLLRAMNSHVLGTAEYAGIYARAGRYRQAA